MGKCAPSAHFLGMLCAPATCPGSGVPVLFPSSPYRHEFIHGAQCPPVLFLLSASLFPFSHSVLSLSFLYDGAESMPEHGRGAKGEVGTLCRGGLKAFVAGACEQQANQLPDARCDCALLLDCDSVPPAHSSSSFLQLHRLLHGSEKPAALVFLLPPRCLSRRLSRKCA